MSEKIQAIDFMYYVATPEFIAKWKAYTKNPKRVTNDPMEAHVIGFNMWVKAVEKAGSTDLDAVIEQLHGNQFDTENSVGDYHDPLDTPLGHHVVMDGTRRIAPYSADTAASVAR